MSVYLGTTKIADMGTVDQTYDGTSTNAQSGTAVAGLLEAIYPVGSVYIGTQATCPLATLISGSTWVLVSAGRVLQGSDSGHAAGTTIEAGLPNITGDLGYLTSNNSADISNQFNGALAWRGYNNYAGTNNVTGGYGNFDIALDASKSNSIYGNSNTVQPPAYVVNIWRRTA